MSLVPYAPAESREIVLRHGSAVVVYDQNLKQLQLRDASRSSDVDLTECPYCHRPLRDTGLDDGHDVRDDSGGDASFVDPQYFRMLHHSVPSSAASSRPPSPQRRLGQRQASGSNIQPPPGAEFVGSSPASPPQPHGISSSAFSQNYFKTFFVEEGELGRGGKGVVLLVKHVLDGVSLGHFACKRVPVGDDHEWLEKVLVEVQLLQNLSHQNLVSYRHVWLEDFQITAFGPSVPCAFILQQYCNAGDLHHYILNAAKSSVTTQQLKERMRRRSKGQAEPPLDMNGPRRMQFDEIFSFFKDITSGLHHLHSNGYIHRDLKPHNCLLHTVGNKTRVLVSDFGEVQVVNVARKSTGATGTISYCAPEVLRREAPDGRFGNFTTKSDIFSLGMIVYFMCFGQLPYRNADDLHEENEDLEELRTEISAWIGFDDERRLRTDLPDKLYKFLKRLLSVDPDERPATGDILQGIGATAGLDESSNFNSSSFFDEMRPRISPADSPSPAPHRRNSRSTRGMLRPPSQLRQPTAEEHRSPSPPAGKRPETSRQLTPPDSSVVLRTRKVNTEPIPPSSLARPPPTPRLMLPPPRTYSSRLYQIFASAGVVMVLKITFFVIKLLSLSRPCTPFAASPWVSYPLLCAAALDFAFMGFGHQRWPVWLASSLLQLTVHLAVVGLAMNWDALCVRRAPVWQHDLQVQGSPQ
ncbi:kinase-like protein [Saccharata proteae CBS 121410]|uniref:non-specific serine/threonine protein kinase n=1 Tax=Saccharata proteae CBS 121410 TaxID=1314787 RepID=A0A9P4M042_9PEZI|nr:kinase-like protein [Saccharata proteae CBS 121410]